MRANCWLMVFLFGLLVLASGAAWADEDPENGPTKSPEYGKAAKAVKEKDFAAAIALLNEVIAGGGGDADAYNLLGYSHRNLGDFEAAFSNYRKALEINPKHRGAHEYIGEAYLKTGNLAKAREHLEKLDDLCFWGCGEYTDLKEAVKAFEARRG